MEIIKDALLEKEVYEDKFTSYVDILRKRSDKSKIIELAAFRKMPVEAFEEASVFYIGEMAEMLVPVFLNDIKHFGVISEVNKKPIFHNRYVFPIRTESGKVQNLVGYRPDADERYIYGTARYYRRNDTLYGLENLYMAYQMGYAVLTEGITDAIRLRSLGIKNAFANCGTHASQYILSQLNRCEYGVIIIPDRDKAGADAKKRWVVNKRIILNPPALYKDIDEMLKEEENHEWFMSYFTECVKILKQSKHLGNKHPIFEVTII